MKGKVRDACHGQGRMAGRWMEENRAFFPVAAADYIFYYQLYFYVFAAADYIFYYQFYFYVFAAADYIFYYQFYFYVFAAADYEHCTFFIQIFFLLLLIVSDF